MAPTGSLDQSIAALSLVNWNNRQEMEASEVFKKYTKGLDNLLVSLKEAGKSGDIDLIIGFESTLVFLEHRFHQGQDSSVMPSLNAAIKDFAVIQRGREIVRDPEGYKAAAATYHSKKHVHGVVIDGCHEALNAHVTRLGNRMSAVGISVPEKNVLQQRQANMRTAKDLYVGLQCRALGVEPPGRGRGQSRGG